MEYRGFNIKWRVYEYSIEEDEEETVRWFENAEEAAKYCIDHAHAGVEMMAFPIKKREAKS